MPAPQKLNTIYALLAKLEASYNAGGAPSPTTDGILLEERPKLTLAYANDGARPATGLTLGHQRRAKPTGRTGSFPVKHAAKGAGAAYSASVWPSLHVLLRAAGFDAAVDTTLGAEKYTYTPTPGPTGYASASLSAYLRGELVPLTGVLADLTSWAFQGPHVPVFEFALQGLVGAISDAGVPAITYPGLALDAPRAVNVTFTLGNLTQAVVRSATLKLGRKLTPRLDVNSAAGHAGFAPGERAPTLEVVYETPALATTPFTAAATIDPYQLYDAGTPVACSLAIGGTQYDKYHWAFPAAQIEKAPEEADDGPVACTKLSLQLNPSTIAANDDLSIIFD